jgi:hypothetical protein
MKMKNKATYSRETFNALPESEKYAKSVCYAEAFFQELTASLNETDLNYKKIEKQLLDYALALAYIFFIEAGLFLKLKSVSDQLSKISKKVSPTIYDGWMQALVKQDHRVINGLIPIIPYSTRTSPEFQKIVTHAYWMKQAQWIGGISIGLGVASLGILIMQHMIMASPYLAIPSLVVGIGLAGLFTYGYRQDQLIQTINQDPFIFDTPRL